MTDKQRQKELITEIMDQDAKDGLYGPNKTPKEKADDLIRKYYSIGAVEVKQCALIAVDEVLATNPYKARSYWQEVRKEIEKL